MVIFLFAVLFVANKNVLHPVIYPQHKIEATISKRVEMSKKKERETQLKKFPIRNVIPPPLSPSVQKRTLHNRDILKPNKD